MAATKGLWSVCMWNWRPSSRKRKWRTAEWAARNSLSNVEYLAWVSESLAALELLQNTPHMGI